MFHKITSHFAFFSLSALLSATTFGQSNIDKIVANFSDYTSNHLQEKVYVHTDRSYYLCGEILWFKTYVENASDNKPLSVSKLVYVEVINKMHQPVLQAKIALKNGSGNGSFQLPLTLESGNYELRAYTNWMKNDSANYFFKKFITIVNTTENLDSSIRNFKIKYLAHFFPEGGNLVNGINSLVAFKINDNTGKGADGHGIIVDQNNDTIAHFQTGMFGMGNFLFTPQNGKHYTAFITLNDSSIIKTELPEAFDNGFVMHLSDEGNQLNVNVSTANASSQQLYLVAETNRNIDFSQSGSLQNNQAVFTINKSDLKEGIAQITLFTANGQPVCERLYFKRPSNKMEINAKTDKASFNKRDLVNIDLSTTDENGKSLAGNLSASVFRLDSLQKSSENIETYLWLTSNLKGYIEDPDYYFKNENPATNAALDNLLLTQGWRSFDWKNISENNRSVFNYVPENYGHIVTGKITNEITGKPAVNILVYLSVPGKRVQLYGCTSDENGFIHFDLKNFYGSQIVLQTNTTKDTIYHMEIFTPFSEEYSYNVFPSLNVSENNRDQLETDNLHMQISNTYHTNDLQKLSPLNVDTLPFYYKPTKTYLLDNYTRFTTMEEVMREYVAEVNVQIRKKQYHFNTVNFEGFELSSIEPTERIFSKDPLILLDGVPVFDVNKIIAYDPLKVQKLEVVAAKYYWGPIVSEGIVSYTTYKGNLPDYSLNPHDVILDYDGLQQQRIFYSPDYSSEKAQQSRLPDFRDLLYWSPDVTTNEKGNGHISFFTGDVPGKYLVVLQGISSNGKAGSESFIFNVVK